MNDNIAVAEQAAENQKSEKVEKVEKPLSEQFGTSSLADIRALVKPSLSGGSELPSLALFNDKDGEKTIYFGSLPEYAAFGGLIFMRHAVQGSSGLIGAAGAYQGYRDFNYLRNSNGLTEQIKYSTALATDATMLAGGVMGVAKLGPKWLAPSLMVGGFAGRLLLDLVPDNKK